MTIMVNKLHQDDEEGILAAGKIAQSAFSHIPFCDTLEEAIDAVREMLEPGKACFVARDLAGTMLGWIGGQHTYAKVWELHPLAVQPEQQRKGVGRRLVQALEEHVAEAGGITITLGADDEFGGTNLFGRYLYPDVLGAAQSLKSINNHPFVFYQKLGYVVTGLVPDANGYGKPDILMCKRVVLDV